MLLNLIAEATECDFKSELEKKKPKSWLKSVSAFANGIGGTLFFGVDNSHAIIGLTDIQADVEFISSRIKERIVPIPDFVLTPRKENGKEILTLDVKAGHNTPYYYTADGVKQAYVRIGSESIPAPDYLLNELILKGSHRTSDTISTDYRKDDYSFTLLEATYLQRTKLHFVPTDYQSFGLVTDDGFLTRAGSLLADQHIVYNSRVFCTRWNGLTMGSVFDDALDDKEYEGNLIYLLQSGFDFIKNNSKMRFVKEAMERIDKPDYADRAVTEALVNALIHRDYLMMGSEIHIDIYDDRVEISSPGGMYSGPAVQEQNIEQIKSERRNPIIADLFHRMRYMERRGSGLKKIINETRKLPGFRDEFLPEFYSTSSTFSVILKNVNYSTHENNPSLDGINDGINKGTNIAEQIIVLIKNQGRITTKELSGALRVSESTIERNLTVLKKQGRLNRVGSRKSGYWKAEE